MFFGPNSNTSRRAKLSTESVLNLLAVVEGRLSDFDRRRFPQLRSGRSDHSEGLASEICSQICSRPPGQGAGGGRFVRHHLGSSAELVVECARAAAESS